jgi:hypothetical protein
MTTGTGTNEEPCALTELSILMKNVIFFREQVQARVMVLKYLNTNEVLACVLTKPLPK